MKDIKKAGVKKRPAFFVLEILGNLTKEEWLKEIPKIWRTSIKISIIHFCVLFLKS